MPRPLTYTPARAETILVAILEGASQAEAARRARPRPQGEPESDAGPCRTGWQKAGPTARARSGRSRSGSTSEPRKPGGDGYALSGRDTRLPRLRPGNGSRPVVRTGGEPSSESGSSGAAGWPGDWRRAGSSPSVRPGRSSPPCLIRRPLTDTPGFKVSVRRGYDSLPTTAIQWIRHPACKVSVRRGYPLASGRQKPVNAPPWRFWHPTRPEGRSSLTIALGAL